MYIGIRKDGFHRKFLTGKTILINESFVVSKLLIFHLQLNTQDDGIQNPTNV